MTDQEKKEEEFMKPFGKEWENEMMQMDKPALVSVIKKICIENLEYQLRLQKQESKDARPCVQ